MHENDSQGKVNAAQEALCKEQGGAAIDGSGKDPKYTGADSAPESGHDSAK